MAKALIDGALAAFRSNKGWADKAVAQLPDDQLHVTLDPNTWILMEAHLEKK